MDDECRFGEGQHCYTHKEWAALCTQAAAALRAKVGALEIELKGTSAVLETYLPPRERTLPHDLAVLVGLKLEKAEARVRELEGQFAETVEEREATVGELDALLKEARDERARAEATVERLKELVPHLEQTLDPFTRLRESSRHLYRVDQHVNESGPEECRRVGGRCALDAALSPQEPPASA